MVKPRYDRDMASIPERALEYARAHNLDLGVRHTVVPTAPFVFKCLQPRESILASFRKAMRARQLWPLGMPIPVVTYHRGRDEWQIMDGMQRICSAQMEGFEGIPAFVASGETHEELYDAVLKEGYFGEDFVEMLAMVDPLVRENLALRDDMRLAGK